MAQQQAQAAAFANGLQGSPVMQRQGTPAGAGGNPNNTMLSHAQSSPLVPASAGGGFPMLPTASQSQHSGAGSPPQRPASAALLNRGAQMARQVSQQQPAGGSSHATPKLTQGGTPGMAQAQVHGPGPNRGMTQTPRLPPGSPAVN
ncbi:Transcription factor spt20, partial [Teratosphaeriaceae sp. CCFEE 6253]